jgi:hypothetical protein
MYASLINYINNQYEQAKLYADTPQEVYAYMKNAYGAVDFFLWLDESEGVDGELRGRLSHHWQDYWYPKFWELMREKA